MNELYHFGILGMKWGVRRYQNKDGTLTEAGKKRYGDDPEKFGEKRVREQMSKAMERSDSKSREFTRKLADKANKTKEGKEYEQVRKTLNDLQDQLHKAHGPNAQLVLSEPDAMYVNQVIQKYNDKLDEIAKGKKMQDEYAKAALSDIGYNDTKKGREYVKRLVYGKDAA